MSQLRIWESVFKEDKKLYCEKVLSSSTIQQKYYNTLDIYDLSFLGDKKNMRPIIDLKDYKEKLSNLSPYERLSHIKKSYAINNLITDAKKSNKYFIGFFDDSNGQRYERGIISNSIVKVYECMQNYDSNRGEILILSITKKRFILMEVYPFSDDFNDFDDYFKNF